MKNINHQITDRSSQLRVYKLLDQLKKSSSDKLQQHINVWSLSSKSTQNEVTWVKVLKPWKQLQPHLCVNAEWTSCGFCVNAECCVNVVWPSIWFCDLEVSASQEVKWTCLHSIWKSDMSSCCSCSVTLLRWMLLLKQKLLYQDIYLSL